MKLQQLLELREQIVLAHLFTKLLSVHKATEFLYEELDSFIDTYTETYIGLNGRESVDLSESEEATESAPAVDTVAASNLFESLHEMILDLDAPTAELENLRDEFVGKVSRAQYMLTLQ